jgi:hypothetical protein
MHAAAAVKSAQRGVLVLVLFFPAMLRARVSFRSVGSTL